MLRAWGLALAGLLLLTSCSSSDDPDVDPAQVNAVDAPKKGACRVLDPSDVREASNAHRVVDCDHSHTAETYAVGELPDRFEDAAYDDRELAVFAYRTCSTELETFLGGDESAVMRSLVSWVWFRPSEKAWDKGARWYRCDVVGGGDESSEYVDLPKTTRDLLLKPADAWMACAEGTSFSEATKVPCSRPHDWRAVTTIKLGEADTKYPGDRVVQVLTRDRCRNSVYAWLGYPDLVPTFAYTWFHEAEWEGGTRRSICWAKTDG